MKTISNLLCLLFVSSCSLFAQDKVKELLKNPDVSWAIESYADFHPDKSNKEHRALKLNGRSDFIKLQAAPYKGKEFYPIADGESHTFSHKFLDKSALEKNKVYESSDLSKELNAEAVAKLLSKVDTIQTFNPVSKEMLRQVIVNAFNPDDVLFYRVKQVVYYNKKDTMFRTIPLAIAPMVGKVDEKGNTTELKPLFWVAVEETTQTNINAPELDWIKRTAYNFSLMENTTGLKENSKLGSIHNEIFDAITKNAEKALVYDVFEILGHAKMTTNELKNIKSSCDTIITFDPNSFEEVVNVVKTNPSEHIQNLRVVQDWVWDAKKQKLYIRFLGFAPIVNRYDAKGFFLNSGPMFYRREKGLN